MTDFTGAQIFLGRIAVSPFALAKFLQIFKRDLRKKPQQIGRGCITIDERKDGPSMCRAQSGCGGLLPAPAEQAMNNRSLPYFRLRPVIKILQCSV